MKNSGKHPDSSRLFEICREIAGDALLVIERHFPGKRLIPQRRGDLQRLLSILWDIAEAFAFNPPLGDASEYTVFPDQWMIEAIKNEFAPLFAKSGVKLRGDSFLAAIHLLCQMSQNARSPDRGAYPALILCCETLARLGGEEGRRSDAGDQICAAE